MSETYFEIEYNKVTNQCVLKYYPPEESDHWIIMTNSKLMQELRNADYTQFLVNLFWTDINNNQITYENIEDLNKLLCLIRVAMKLRRSLPQNIPPEEIIKYLIAVLYMKESPERVVTKNPFFDVFVNNHPRFTEIRKHAIYLYYAAIRGKIDDIKREEIKQKIYNILGINNNSGTK